MKAERREHGLQKAYDVVGSIPSPDVNMYNAVAKERTEINRNTGGMKQAA